MLPVRACVHDMRTRARGTAIVVHPLRVCARAMICNLCLKPLATLEGDAGVFITVCSHVFCAQCARTSFAAQAEESAVADDEAPGTAEPSSSSSSSSSRHAALVLCPVCDTPLTIPDGAEGHGTVFQSHCPAVRRAETGAPCDERDIVPLVMQRLCGFDPGTLMLMAQKAAEFWLYQQRFGEEQRAGTLAQQAARAQDAAQAAEAKAAELQCALQAEQRKTALVMEECEEQRSKADDMQEKIVELTRQKRKLTELYNALKARHSELIVRVGVPQPQQPQQSQDNKGGVVAVSTTPLQAADRRACSSRAGAAATVLCRPDASVRATQRLFPCTPSLTPGTATRKRPLPTPGFSLSANKGHTQVVLNLAARTAQQSQSQQSQQTSAAPLEKAPSRAARPVVVRPPSEKRQTLASKWDILSSGFDAHQL